MTILQSLARQYDRMAEKEQYDRMAEKEEVTAFGYSHIQIGWVLEFNSEGDVVDFFSIGGVDGKGRTETVPSPPEDRRGKKVVSSFLWDPTPYALGVSLDPETKHISLTANGAPVKFAEFQRFHSEVLANEHEDGLCAFLKFLKRWTPEQFAAKGLSEDALGANIAFRLSGDHRLLHDTPAAKNVWNRLSAPEGEPAQCLITGEAGPIARLHPSIKGVMKDGKDAQSSGAKLVSFNLGDKPNPSSPSSSYGKSQGDNAPVSEVAAFKYAAALNAMLAKGSTRKTRIGDATVAFWAEAGAGGEDVAGQAEAGLSSCFSPSDEDEEDKALALLKKIGEGRGDETGEAELLRGTRIHILGLAPNAARLAVRFWHVGTFGDFARRMVEHWNDLRLKPPAWKGDPAAWMLLYEIAAQRKADNIPPLLGGALMRAILTGGAYPRPLLAAAITRLRAGDPINGPRAGVIKACLVRDGRKPEERKGDLVSLDRTETNPGYLLGRLFAVLETAQRLALGKVNATIRDRFFASASATPAGTFPTLLRNANPHLGKLRKGEKSGLGVWLELEIAEIVGKMDSEMPASLKIEDQGRFVIGYYHQRYTRRDDKPTDIAQTDQTPHEDAEEGDEA